MSAELGYVAPLVISLAAVIFLKASLLTKVTYFFAFISILLLVSYTFSFFRPERNGEILAVMSVFSVAVWAGLVILRNRSKKRGES